ncbi:MAG: transaldolase family protein [Vicinamibacteria bacterium]|nr:transaldolase family protein [Vicinamibacteria bacterium]
MRLTVQKGAEFWNDSCSLTELADAVAHGATGATSNPVIVSAVVKADPKTWNPVLDDIVAANPTATEDEIAWLLIEEIGRQAAKILLPVHARTAGTQGYLSIQVSPKFHANADRMIEHGRALAGLAPNIAIKIPSTAAGVKAAEELVAEGINVNATVSFTVSQAVTVAEAFERGLDRAQKGGADMTRLHPYMTLMVGRLDDLLQRVMVKEQIAIDPGYLAWAGIAVFKRAHEIFTKRGFRASLLAAAYRHHLHWSQLIGPGVILTMPYAWWKQFEASDIEVEETLDRKVRPEVLEALQRKFRDFNLAYDEGALAPPAFASYGASVHTLNQFLGGYQELLGLVRERMLEPRPQGAR